MKSSPLRSPSILSAVIAAPAPAASPFSLAPVPGSAASLRKSIFELDEDPPAGLEPGERELLAFHRRHGEPEHERQAIALLACLDVSRPSRAAVERAIAILSDLLPFTA